MINIQLAQFNISKKNLHGTITSSISVFDLKLRIGFEIPTPASPTWNLFQLKIIKIPQAYSWLFVVVSGLWGGEWMPQTTAQQYAGEC